MKLLKSRRVRFVILALLIAPPALWALVLTLVPTAWARNRVTEALAKAVGQPVQLADLQLGPLGGVQLLGLEISAPQAEATPWLKVASLSIDINLAQLVWGHLEPRVVEARGVDLRVHRFVDGRFEFSDLLQDDPNAPPTPPTTEPTHTEPGPLTFRLAEATIRVIDDRSGTKLDFDDVQGHGTRQKGRVEVAELKGKLNGGPFELGATYDHVGGAPAFEGQFRAEDVALGVGMDALGYLVPVLSSRGTESLDGTLDLNLYLRGQGAGGAEIRQSLAGQGTIALDPIRLDSSRILSELSAVLPLPADRRGCSVHSQFAIKDGRVSTRDLTIQVARVPIMLTGWTSFDGQLDYQVKSEELSARAEGLTARLPAEARGFLDDLPIKLNDLMNLRITGTFDRLALSVDGVPLTGRRRGEPIVRPEDRAKLRQSGRRLLDRILR